MWALPPKRNKLSLLLKSKLFLDEKIKHLELQIMIDKLK